ncbi:hypothetical protein B0H19DRAFT_1271881 [Mycena capillaripes]|nr:hypothetical protein B0H19DRAFT_1271881 [Mycena capillaripes]
MHRTLAVPEIVRMIFSELGTFSEDEARHTLAVLVRTCIAFHDPALDILWRSASVPRVLIYALPTDLWNREDVVGNEGPQTRFLSMRAMLPEDWERVPVYSKRIRILRCALRHTFDFKEVFATVALCPPPRSIFPNLHTINWEHGEDLTLFRAFGGPMISSISFTTFRSGPHLTLLPYIAQIENLVDHVGFHGAYGSSDWRHFDAYMRVVPTGIADTQTSVLSTLKSLTMYNITPAVHLYPCNHPTAPLFPALQSLTVLSDDVSLPEPMQMTQFYEILAQHNCHDVLQRLTIQLPALFVALPGAGLSSIQALTSLRHLTHVQIASPAGFDLDDTGLSALAQAWSHLEELLLSSVDPPIQPLVTLASLDTFARCCPRLHNLAIALNAGIVPSLSDDAPIQQNCLRRMTVGNFPCGAPAAVAKYLSALFPNLSVLTAEDMWDSDPWEQRWREVQTLLLVFLEIRAQERLWATRVAVSRWI